MIAGTSEITTSRLTAGGHRRTSFALDDAGCHSILTEVGWGVLSVVEQEADAESRPYAVPVAYAFDGEGLYVATRRGRKLRALEKHPLFSLTVLQVERFDRWRSVVVTGKPIWLTLPSKRALAIQAFAGQRRPGGLRLTRRDTERLLGARILRMEVCAMSGRACGEWLDVTAGLTPHSHAAESDNGSRIEKLIRHDDASEDAASNVMDDIRRIVRALHTASSQSQRDLGVSAAQLFVLRQMAVKAGQSMGDIAQRTRTSQSSVSEVVARLVRRGLVARQAASDDRRRAVLTLTPAGREVLRSAPDTIQERLLDGLGRLPSDQRQLLAEMLSAWLAEAGLREVPPTMFLEPSLEADDA